MHRRLYLCAAAILAALTTASGAFSPAPAAAQEFTRGESWSGGWIVRVCGSTDDTDLLVCNTYLRGLWAGVLNEAYHQGNGEISVRTFCMPEPIDLDVMAAVVAREGRLLEEEWSTPADVLVGFILSREWPCDTGAQR